MEKVLKNCTVIDTENKRYLTRDIYIDALSVISKISAPETINHQNYEIIDCEGSYVLPGLINAHSHLFSSGKPMSASFGEGTINFGYRLLKTTIGQSILRKIMDKHAQIQLQSGTTTIRSVGEFFYQDVKLREIYAKDEKIGPSLLVSGFFLSITGGHGAPYLALESDSPWEGRKNVRKSIKQGVDWIKICATGGVTDARRIGEAGALQFTEEEITAICEEAHKVGVKVAAHVESTEGVRISLRGGVDTIEHGAPMDEEIIQLYNHNPKSLRGYTSLIPTFQAGAPFAFLAKEESGLNEIAYQNGKMVYEHSIESARQAIENDIAIGMGNDASMKFVTHYDFWRELAHFVDHANLSTWHALDIATRQNAKIIGVDHVVGSIEVGKKADIIVLSENPVEDIKALTKISKVFKNGKLVQRKKVRKYPELDQLLDKILK
ncbi:metal-dependent hydrolase family protein [Marinilactibacillus kalidii]|uniref:metal-dependent hydrolase family protein n=1 Tax=Marinilactibacillus kalidii TaxID=2820274 RepID=UPI001ABE3399|nr:amidohydrolase family protein [Marinilactibacillus kalidii]